MIYFAQPATGGPVKIGHTENLPLRLRSLQTTYGKQMIVRKTTPGGAEEERWTHQQFASYRIEDTEQFRPGPDLMKFLGLDPVEGWESVKALGGKQANGRVHAFQMRLTQASTDNIQAIRQRFGFETDVEAVRYALHMIANHSTVSIGPEYSEKIPE